MARTMKLDFTGVESFLRASEGEHVCKIANADVKQSQGGNDMIVVQYEVIKGDDKGARVFENYPLVDTALWKLKGMLQAIGIKADGKVALDLDKLIGKVLTVVVFHEEYEGKVRAKVDSVKKYSAATKEEDDEVEEELPFGEEEEEKTEKKPKATQKKAPMNPPADEDEDDDWDEEEDEEPEEKPEPKKEKKAKKEEKPVKKAPKKEKSEDEDDDWEDDDWDE